ncbi:MAG: DUF4926 domain-containing protein [Phototrophicaceae bacterium]
MINEHEQVVITTDLPEHDLKAGDVGVVVHIYHDGVAYELEIFALDGRTLDVVTVEAQHVRAVSVSKGLRACLAPFESLL